VQGSYWSTILRYFDVKHIIECELEPNRQYIVGIHPHGVTCLVWTVLLWHGCGIGAVFVHFSSAGWLLEEAFPACFHGVEVFGHAHSVMGLIAVMFSGGPHSICNVLYSFTARSHAVGWVRLSSGCCVGCLDVITRQCSRTATEMPALPLPDKPYRKVILCF
jgi:hypothetical protein